MGYGLLTGQFGLNLLFIELTDTEKCKATYFVMPGRNGRRSIKGLSNFSIIAQDVVWEGR